MTKSEIFTKAHAIAKKTVAIVGDYVVALSLALKEVYKSMSSIESKLVAEGLKVWEGGAHRRIYLNHIDDYVKAFSHVEAASYKRGFIKTVSINGEELSATKTGMISTSKVYFDCVAEHWVCEFPKTRAFLGI